jgi:hypothetical protein
MNLFNRIFIFLLCLGLIAGAISVTVLAWTIPLDTIGWLQDSVNWLAEHNQDLEKGMLTAIAGAVAFFALMLGLLQLLPESGSQVKVTDLKAGDAVLSTTAIAQRVDDAIRLVPHVVDAHTAIRAKRKGVQVSLDLHVDPEANLATVTDEACETVQDVLMNRVHVALAEPPRVRLHYRELRLRRPAASQAEPLGTRPSSAPVSVTPADLEEALLGPAPKPAPDEEAKAQPVGSGSEERPSV